MKQWKYEFCGRRACQGDEALKRRELELHLAETQLGASWFKGHCHVRCVSVTWEDRSGEYRNAVVQGPSLSG